MSCQLSSMDFDAEAVHITSCGGVITPMSSQLLGRMTGGAITASSDIRCWTLSLQRWQSVSRPCCSRVRRNELIRMITRRSPEDQIQPNVGSRQALLVSAEATMTRDDDFSVSAGNSPSRFSPKHQRPRTRNDLWDPTAHHEIGNASSAASPCESNLWFLCVWKT